jgi:hypothetical protein
MPRSSAQNKLAEVDTRALADAIVRHASETMRDEDVKIRVELTLRPILEKWGIQWASHEQGHRMSGKRKDALYGHVIIEYKALGKLDSKAEFARAKQQVKDYIQKEAAGEQNLLGTLESSSTVEEFHLSGLGWGDGKSKSNPSK